MACLLVSGSKRVKASTLEVAELNRFWGQPELSITSPGRLVAHPPKQGGCGAVGGVDNPGTTAWGLVPADDGFLFKEAIVIHREATSSVSGCSPQAIQSSLDPGPAPDAWKNLHIYTAGAAYVSSVWE